MANNLVTHLALVIGIVIGNYLHEQLLLFHTAKRGFRS